MLTGVTRGDGRLSTTRRSARSSRSIPSTSEDEAIAQANDSATGSTSASGPATPSAAGESPPPEAGTVNVNEAYAAAWASVDAPMGGMKDSGSAAATASTGS